VSSHIELQPADHEEPTWEMPHERPHWRRLDRRTRSLLAAAAAAAVVVNAGAAWAYWRITGSETGRLDSGTAGVDLELRARSDLNRPFARGETGDLTVAVVNEHDFPIRVVSIVPGTGTIVADVEHRDQGCRSTGVELIQPRFDVSWDVPRNTVGAFSIDDALFMRPDANRSCEGATFTVPVRAAAVTRAAP
jgi:hypothetical protein